MDVFFQFLAAFGVVGLAVLGDGDELWDSLEWEEFGEGIGQPLEILLLASGWHLGGGGLEDVPNFSPAAEGEEYALDLLDFEIGDEHLHSFEQALGLDALPPALILIVADTPILHAISGTYSTLTLFCGLEGAW